MSAFVVRQAYGLCCGLRLPECWLRMSYSFSHIRNDVDTLRKLPLVAGVKLTSSALKEAENQGLE